MEPIILTLQYFRYPQNNQSNVESGIKLMACYSFHYKNQKENPEKKNSGTGDLGPGPGQQHRHTNYCSIPNLVVDN